MVAKVKSKKAKVKPSMETLKPVSLVTILLDRSGSMSDILMETIEGFNTYLTKLQQDKKSSYLFTQLQFDSNGVQKDFVATSIGEIPLLSRETFVPRGGTPLIDAIWETIEAMDIQIARFEVRPKIILTIQTDGEENQSQVHRNDWNGLKALIEKKKAEGWEINFIGAGLESNAYEQSRLMGIDDAHTMSYGKGLSETRMAFAASASNHASFSRGTMRSTGYSAKQKLAAGDHGDLKLRSKT